MEHCVYSSFLLRNYKYECINLFSTSFLPLSFPLSLPSSLSLYYRGLLSSLVFSISAYFINTHHYFLSVVYQTWKCAWQSFTRHWMGQRYNSITGVYILHFNHSPPPPLEWIFPLENTGVYIIELPLILFPPLIIFSLIFFPKNFLTPIIYFIKIALE